MLKYKNKILKYSIIVIFLLASGIIYSLEVEQNVSGAEKSDFETKESNFGISGNYSETRESNSETGKNYSETEEDISGTEINNSVSGAYSADTGGNGLIAEKNSEKLLCVYVCGEVNSPGVYELSCGTRINDAVNAAGGMTENADSDYLNLALFLSDGQKIYVPSLEEVAGSDRQTEKLLEMSGYTSGNSVSDNGNHGSEADKTLININSAGLSELVKLPGIGEKRAQTIIDYRNSCGPFKAAEDIKKVSGIKDSLFEKIKEYICVD